MSERIGISTNTCGIKFDDMLYINVYHAAFVDYRILLEFVKWIANTFRSWGANNCDIAQVLVGYHGDVSWIGREVMSNTAPGQADRYQRFRSETGNVRKHRLARDT
jgi:hypothetical protein